MYHHFTREDRIALAALLRAGHSQAEAARAIGFDPSAVSRELRRNPKDDGSYHATHADVLARERRKESKRGSRKIENDVDLATRIESLLHPLRSPEVITHEVGIVHQTSVSHLSNL
jgi:IS30 family transposase